MSEEPWSRYLVALWQFDEKGNRGLKAEANMERMELTYNIKGFDRVLYNKPPSWRNCEFSMNEDEKNGITALLCVWEEINYKEVNTIEQLERIEKELEQKVQSFILALKFMLKLPLKRELKEKKVPSIILQDGSVHCSSIAIASDELESDYMLSAPPKEMPSLPLECEPWVLTLVEAAVFKSYVEEQFKRQHLIIEELWGEFKHEFNDEEMQKLKLKKEEIGKEIKWLRDFVSHAICNKKGVVKFISKNLPTSIVPGGVKFLRGDVNHRNFVARYEAKSRQLAHHLVEKKIAELLSSI